MIALSQTSVVIDGETLFQIPKFVLKEGDRCGLLAPNGTGKSVFFQQLDDRTLSHSCSIAYGSQQLPTLFSQSPSLNHCVMNAPEGFLAQEFYAITDRFRLDLDKKVSELSGGQQRQAWLAYILAQPAQVLLLDEPTNHLDLPSILWLQQYLKEKKTTYLIVSHDRYFLEELVTGYWGIYERQIRYYPGSLADFEQKRSTEEQALMHEQRCEDQAFAQEQRYKERGVTARRKRNQRRLEKLEELRDKIAERTSDNGLDFAQGSGTALPQKQQIVRLSSVIPHYYDPEKAQAFQLPPIDTILTRQERVALVGANGRGKTTLLKKICEMAPGVWLRPDLSIGIVDQHRTLDESGTVGQLLSPDPHRVAIINQQGETELLHPVTYLSKFGFERSDLSTLVSKLSGGQRMKLCLALLMRQPRDLLILDEPTNDLDLESLEELADFISQFPSLVILISHDRYLIDQCATQTWYLGPQGLHMDRGGVCSQRLKNLFHSEKAPTLSESKKTASMSKPQSQDKLIQKIEKMEQRLSMLDTELSDNPQLFEAAHKKKLNEIMEKRSQVEKAIEELYQQL